MGLLWFGLYFLVGAVEDFLICAYYRAVSARRVYLVMVLAALISLIVLVAVTQIIVSRQWWLILGYALGNGIGAGLGLKVKMVKNERHD